MITIIAFSLAYVITGVLKLKFFDLNRESDWIAMWNDPRSMRAGVFWLWVCVILCWLTWPIILFSRDKYEMVDEWVGQGNFQFKTGKKRKLLVSKARIKIAMYMFHLQWAGFLGMKKRK